jgi:hypothetical protein
VKRFLETLKRPMTIGVTVGTALFIFFLSVQGPARCRDGWASPSIGRQGACSHHGGVSTSPLLFELMLSALVGWAAAALRNRPLERQRLAERQAQQEFIEAELKAKAHEDGTACPLCGFPLRPRRAHRGKNRGVYFMGCSRYPLCKGTRDLTPTEASAIPKRLHQQRRTPPQRAAHDEP